MSAMSMPVPVVCGRQSVPGNVFTIEEMMRDSPVIGLGTRTGQ